MAFLVSKEVSQHQETVTLLAQNTAPAHPGPGWFVGWVGALYWRRGCRCGLRCLKGLAAMIGGGLLASWQHTKGTMGLGRFAGTQQSLGLTGPFCMVGHALGCTITGLSYSVIVW